MTYTTRGKTMNNSKTMRKSTFVLSPTIVFPPEYSVSVRFYFNIVALTICLFPCQCKVFPPACV